MHALRERPLTIVNLDVQQHLIKSFTFFKRHHGHFFGITGEAFYLKLAEIFIKCCLRLEC